MKETTISEQLGKALGNYYDRTMMDMMTNNTAAEMLFGKVVGYRKQRVPKYLYIPFPAIEKHYNEDGEYEGLLISVYQKRLFRIGTEIVEVPIYKKKKSTIKFARNGKVETKTPNLSVEPLCE